jgi:hypothetical protein
MGINPTDPMDEARRKCTKYLAIVIRNFMEDFHHKYLSDEQMKELNPIIRNAIYTAFYANENQQRSSRAKEFVRYHNSMIPKYWEEPELVGGL